MLGNLGAESNPLSVSVLRNLGTQPAPKFPSTLAGQGFDAPKFLGNAPKIPGTRTGLSLPKLSGWVTRQGGRRPQSPLINSIAFGKSTFSP